MCAWGITCRPPRTPGGDPELPTPLSQLGPSLEKGHHEQHWLGGTRGAKSTSLGCGDSEALPRWPEEQGEHGGEVQGRTWRQLSKGLLKPDLFPGHPLLSQFCLHSPAQRRSRNAAQLPLPPPGPSSFITLFLLAPAQLCTLALHLGSAPSQPARRHQGWFFMFPLSILHRERGFSGSVDPLAQPSGVSSSPMTQAGSAHTPPHTHTPSPCHHRGSGSAAVPEHSPGPPGTHPGPPGTHPASALGTAQPGQGCSPEEAVEGRQQAGRSRAGMLQQLPPARLADALWPGAARIFFQPFPRKKKTNNPSPITSSSDAARRRQIRGWSRAEASRR